MQKNLTLYSYYRSSCSYRVRIAFFMKKIPFDYQGIHLLKNGGEQNSNSYRKLNPKGEVPFLQEGDWGTAQSMAILFYLDDLYPQPRLFPSNPKEKARVIELCELINAGIQPLQNLRVLQELEKRFSISPEAKNDWITFWINLGLEALEQRLQDFVGPYATGNQVTALDLFIVPQMYNARRYQMNLDVYPWLMQIEENCLKLEAFQKAIPEVQPDAN